MSEIQTCPKCRLPLPANSPAGICPKCLLNAGFMTESFTAGFTPPDPSELAAHFPDYEIGELLGKGGMGAVYQARQNRLDRPVAIKILPPEVSRDPAFAERFAREARTLAILNHPNIVQVYDFGLAGEYFYFVMEFVDGLNLRQVIQSGNLQSQEALEIVPDICSALQFAHDAGVVHRDIKPENILLDKQGRVKIADFGLAMLLENEPSHLTLTGTNQVMGTPHYMAPEQMRGARTIDHRADIFSLGVVFYELLTGELPIGRFDAPSKKVKVDVRLDDVVLRSLESKPDRRYQNASDVRIQVESIMESYVERNPLAPPIKPKEQDSIRSQLRGPAYGLFVASIVNFLAVIFMISFPVVAHLYTSQLGIDPEGLGELTFLSVIAAAFSLGAGIVLLVGSARLFDLQSYPLAMFAAVMGVLPLSAGFPLSIIFGIWALLILSRRDVKPAFAGESIQEPIVPAQESKQAFHSSIGWTIMLGMGLGLAIGQAKDDLATYMLGGLVVGTLLGVFIDGTYRWRSKD